MLRLFSKKYGDERLEAACAHALPKLTSPRYRHLKAILDSNLDEGPSPASTEQGSAKPLGPPTRGRLLPESWVIAVIDKETRRKLRGKNMGEMVEALDLQEADRTCMSMPFDERVRMMVDHACKAKHSSSVKRLTQRAQLRFPAAEPG